MTGKRGAVGAKSDAGDAVVITEYVRLRQHRLKVVAPYSGQTRALRTVVCTPRGPRGHAGGGDEPTRGPAGDLVAGCQVTVRRH
jgi:hypothetical protein